MIMNKKRNCAYRRSPFQSLDDGDADEDNHSVIADDDVVKVKDDTEDLDDVVQYADDANDAGDWNNANVKRIMATTTAVTMMKLKYLGIQVEGGLFGYFVYPI